MSSETPRRHGPLQAALVFMTAILIAANLILLASRPPAGALMPQQRRQDASRLARLAASSRALSDGAATVQLTLTFGNRCGQPLGLALLSQVGRRNHTLAPETQLWFSLLTEELLPREPGKPLPPAVMMVRHPTASDLNPLTTAAEGRLGLELLHSPGSEQRALKINNLQGAEAQGVSILLSHPLASMARGTHCRFRAQDVEMFALLARLLRARICDDVASRDNPCFDSTLTIYREGRPDVYHLELRAWGEDLGTLHVRLTIHRDPTGIPVEATYRLLPHTDLQKTANLFFTAPHPRGEHLHPKDPGFTGLQYLPPMHPRQEETRRVYLETLLEGTDWLRAERQSSEGGPADPGRAPASSP